MLQLASDGAFASQALKRDDLSESSSRFRSHYLSMLFSENRKPLFGIMLENGSRAATPGG